MPLRRDPVEIAADRLVRLATAPGTSPRLMRRAVRDTLTAWGPLADARRDELRGLLVAGLAEARALAQGGVSVLEAGVEVLG